MTRGVTHLLNNKIHMTFMQFSLDKNKVQFKSRPAIGFDNFNKNFNVLASSSRLEKY